MSKSRPTRIALLAILALYIWIRALARARGLGDILGFSVAGVTSAIALCWICWTFASVTFTRRTAGLSAIIGLVVFTPLIYMMLTGYTDKTGSAIVLAVTAAAIAAMTGAVWSVAHLVRHSFTEWKNDRSHTVTFSMEEPHR